MPIWHEDFIKTEKIQRNKRDEYNYDDSDTIIKLGYRLCRAKINSTNDKV